MKKALWNCWDCSVTTDDWEVMLYEHIDKGHKISRIGILLEGNK